MSKTSQFLTSRQLADSLGVSESSVKRWVDDGTIAADRTAGGHRRIPIASAIGFIRRRRAPLANASVLPLLAPPQVGEVDADCVNSLHEALIQDDQITARSIITGRYLGGANIASLGDELIRPVMQRIGELWHHDPEGVLLEHRAVDLCMHVLAEIGSWLPPLPDDSPSAVTSAQPDDPYLLPPMLSNLVLRECGMRSHNLGPNTPMETLAIACERYKARLCSISVSVIPSARHESAWLAFEKRVSAAGVRIVVGGRCSGSLSVKVREKVRLCESMTECSAYATGWLEGFRRPPLGKGDAR